MRRRGAVLRRAVGSLSRRARAARDRVLYPEARSAAEQWQRVVMSDDVDARIAALGPERLSAVEISGESHAAKPWKHYTSLQYPSFDICAPVPDDLGFDVVICEQVIEHVPDPFLAASNLLELCVPGGRAIVSTPFLIKVHELEQYGMRDYWRFTPRGLRTLLERAGFEVESVNAWGNRQCVVGNLGRWSALRPWHSLRDEPDVPVQVWALARRPPP